MATTNQFTVNSLATYKGRTYRVVWAGKTKFGEKVKLAFMDGSTEFWADASACAPKSGGTSTTRGQRGRCENCGERAHCCTRPGCNCGGYDCLS